MEFGLWVEPEMVNPDSDLFRAHPDWVLSGARPAAGCRAWRHQQVLDLANPGCYGLPLRAAGRAAAATHDIAYLKWDHNRDLVEAGHDGRPGVHAQTLAVYRLLDELRRRHPGVEIESCASGGGRVDLGILARTDRVWASDCNDALERQHIQRWTGLLLPPELVGSHVGPPRVAHHRPHPRPGVPGRDGAVRPLRHRVGHRLGLARAEQQALAEAIACYRRLRPLLHGGHGGAGRPPEPGRLPARGGRRRPGRGAVRLRAAGRLGVRDPGPARLPGLDPGRAYRVTPLAVAGEPETKQVVAPRWLAAGGVTLAGRVLAEVGLPLPVLRPEQALLLHLTSP